MSLCLLFLFEDLETLEGAFEKKKKKSLPFLEFPGGSDGKASVYDVGDPGLILGLGRSLGEGNGNPLQHTCLENSMD